MAFEFDPQKSADNAEKHGIDFVQAQRMWADMDAITLPSNYPAEPRQILIAMLDEKLWAAVFTLRGDNVRIISVRRARDSERNVYEQE